MMVLLATAFFAIFVGLHVLAVLLGQRLDRTPPRLWHWRVRYARMLAAVMVTKAVWFAVLVAVAATTVVLATPRLPMLEMIIVYGGLIGIITSAFQATQWFRSAQRIRASAASIEVMSLDTAGIVQASPTEDSVAVVLDRGVLERLLRDGHVTAADFGGRHAR